MTNKTPEQTIKEDLQNIIEDSFRERLGKGEIEFEDYKRSCDVLERCNTLQLWTLYRKFILNKTPIVILNCDPADHLAVHFAGMYVGIEPCGYAHS